MRKEGGDTFVSPKQSAEHRKEGPPRILAPANIFY